MMQVSRFLLALFLSLIFIQSRAQIRTPDHLSPASCMKKLEALSKTMQKDEVLVVFSGQIPLRAGSLPSRYSADPLFHYLTGVNTPGAVLLLSARPISFGETKAQRFLFSHQGSFDPSLPVQIDAPGDAPYAKNWTGISISKWDDFIQQVLTQDSVKRINLWSPSSTSFQGEGAELPEPIADLFRIAGPGEPYYAWTQGLLSQILTATENNFQQVVLNVLSMVEYRPIAKEIGFIREAMRITSYDQMSSLQASLKQAKISLVVDAYSLMEKLKGTGFLEETAAARQLANALKAAFTQSLSHAKEGKSDMVFGQAIEYQLSLAGCTGQSVANVWTGPNAGYFSSGEARMLAGGDVVVCETIAKSGCFSLSFGRTFRVSGAFEKKQKAVFDWALARHKELCRVNKQDIIAGKYLVPGTKDAFIEFLKGAGVKLTRAQESSPVFAQSYHILGPVEMNAIRPLWEGALAEATTEIRFPASAGYPEDLNGFGVLFKDVLLIGAEGVENLTAGIPWDEAGIAALRSAGQ